MPTLLDVVRHNLMDHEVGLVDETIRAHPELQQGDARSVPGVYYQTLVRTALGNPQGGSFRQPNSGSTPINHTYEMRKIECLIVEPRFQCDKALADASVDGPEAFIAEQNSGTLEGEMQGQARSFYYGTDPVFGNPAAFPGLLQSYDSVNMVIDATGTTDTTCSSVWAVKFGPQAVRWVMGMNGLMQFSPLRVESIIDPANAAKRFDGYIQTMLFRPGLQIATTQAAARIKKLTNDAGKGLTDALLSELLAIFHVNMTPNAFFMSRRSRDQLRRSRTAVNPTGAPAPIPTEAFGIPIFTTEALVDTETLAL